MGRRRLSPIILAAVLVIEGACVFHTTKQVDARVLSTAKARQVRITGFVKKSGETIGLSKGWAVFIGDTYVVAAKPGQERVRTTIELADVREFVADSAGKKRAAIMADGTAYWIIATIGESSRTLTVECCPDTIAVPISEIEFLLVRRVRVIMTILASLVVLYGLVLIFGLIDLVFIKKLPVHW